MKKIRSCQSLRVVNLFNFFLYVEVRNGIISRGLFSKDCGNPGSKNGANLTATEKAVQRTRDAV